jgi:hypothetical protein
MISTVTVSTVSTVTTAALAGSVALIGVLVLLSLLLQKEIASASTNQHLIRLRKALNVGIFPLMFAFVMLVASKVASVLR